MTSQPFPDIIMNRLKISNKEGVLDSLFQEFLSQPGERQYCSELLLSVSKGKLSNFCCN